MKIADIMTRPARTIDPETSLRGAAALMADLDTGALLVEESDRLVGMLSDRDIVVRALAQGLGAETPVRQVMSGDVRYCYEDQSVDHVAQNMADLQVRRMPVLDRQKRLVGVVSLANFARCRDDLLNATLLYGVAGSP
ncbi:CBS domain-containing protein [Pseudomonas mangiferae]|uniref:CBS domain-containing protein n=1 Tax=Pseudomonas mangiferae TaxID=2593654 RepID=A0A553GVR3_9PSED|nr:CBS domain-containing protein [Pseudomonas mangiferae]TRX73536.1 CBS domain-containing protein [Pseudomonas mangiferae]